MPDHESSLIAVTRMVASLFALGTVFKVLFKFEGIAIVREFAICLFDFSIELGDGLQLLLGFGAHVHERLKA